MKKIILSIDGMTCSACSNGLEKYISKQKGILNCSVNLVMATANVEYDEKVLDIKQIEEFVKQAGFKSLGEFKNIDDNTANKKEKIYFFIFTILAIILLYISMGHMLNLPAIPFLAHDLHPIKYTVTLLILTILFICYGFDILKNGYKNLIHKIPNMDSLVFLGVTSSLLYSLYNTYLVFNGNYDMVKNLYFESAAIVIYFIKLGRYIDKFSKDKTKDAIKSLVKITPNVALLKVGNTANDVKEVTIDEIKKGDIIIARPGDKIAVDGKIVSGTAHIDESFITGESKPVAKTTNDSVIAGSINYDGYIEYEAHRIGKESTISEMVRLVVEASNTKALISKVADKVSSIFVPCVIIIALITFIVYLLLRVPFSSALTTFVTVLLIACPCSLGLATPLAIVIAQGLCANNKILVKKSEILENAQKVNTVVFDKTGTLTYGKLKISKIINYSNIKNKELLQIVASIEKNSTHPIAKAFVDYINENKIDSLDVTEFSNISGLGLKGKIDNDIYILGNSKILEKYNIKNDHLQDENKLTNNSNSIVYVVKNSTIIAIIGINDIVRKNAKDIISLLNKENIETIMLTGDNDITAKKIAKDIGIKRVISNVLPKEKADVIKKLKEENRYVLMCGDGINDSLALTVSDIGVSVNTATDIAMDSSDVILTSGDLKSILTFIKISRKTIKNIKQNLFWAFFYNTLMIPIAIGVLKPLHITINPMIASFAMVLSSLTVTLNALRLKKIKI